MLRFLLSAAAVQWTEQAKKIKAILHKVPRLDVTKVSSKENLPSIVRTKSGGRLKYSAPAGGDDTLRRKGRHLHWSGAGRRGRVSRPDRRREAAAPFLQGDQGAGE